MKLIDQPTYAALEHAKRGWPVIPLHNPIGNACSCGRQDCSSVGKHPRTKNGVHDATTKPITICEWWNRWPEANIGIATGATSQLVVVDIDPRHAGDKSWENFVAEYSPEATLEVSTGGGGKHLYYRFPAEGIGNRTNILPGVDIRGDGGYIVAPPSVHGSGGTYQWSNEQEVDVFPGQLLTAPRAQPTANLQKLPEGTRNSSLYAIAATMRRVGMDEGTVHSGLSALNTCLCDKPLPGSELKSIVRSAVKHIAINLDWKEPKPLPGSNPEAPFLSAKLLPPQLAPWIEDICDCMQVPLEFVAVPAIVGAGIVIGRQVGLHPKREDDWLVIANLWGGVIARPGCLKSPAIAEAMKPMSALIKARRAEFEAALVVARAKEDVIKSAIEGLKEKIKRSVKNDRLDDLPALESAIEEQYQKLDGINVTEKRYKTNDATVEKIGSLLLENPEGLLVFRDELAGWLSTLDRTGREGDREFFLESWNGYGDFSVDRVSRGTLHIPALCLSIFGGLQPAKLHSYV